MGGGGEDAGAGGADRVAERDARAVGVEPLVGGVDLPLAQDGEDLGGEGLVELDQADLVEGEPGPIEGGAAGEDGPDAHPLGLAAGDGPRLERQQRSQATLLGLGPSGHDAHRGAVVLAGRVAGGDRRLLVDVQPDRAQRGELLQRDVGTRVLVAVDDDIGLAAAAGDGHWDQLVGELAGLVGGHGPLVGAQRELVLLLAPDAVVTTQVLRGLDHAAGERVVLAARGLASPVEAIEQLDAALLDPAAQPERVVLDVGHRLRAAGHDEVRGAGGDRARGVQDRLKARPAAAVDLETGDAGAEAGVEGRDAADRGVLAARVAVTEDDVVDVALLEAGALDQLAQDRRGEVGRGQRRQGAEEPADRGAEGLADDDVVGGAAHALDRTRAVMTLEVFI